MLNFAMRGVKQLHFVGIGGAGMCGIAEVFHTLGFVVTGSDAKASEVTDRLSQQGIKVFIGHDAQNIAEADAVVVSTAIDLANPEILVAKEKGLPVLRRAEMLAELMRFKYGIAVSGTHGKTTVTSMMAFIFTQAGLDPTYVIGGKVKQFDHNAKLGKGQYFIAEADESDASFLHLSPMAAVITNIGEDHMQTYAGDVSQLEQAFYDFAMRLPFYGFLVGCSDDARVKKIMDKLPRKSFSYGVNKDADYCFYDYKIQQGVAYFSVKINGVSYSFQSPLPGQHNVENAVVAIAVSHQLGIEIKDIQNGLKNFPGIARRFDRYEDVEVNGKFIDIVDDYGHHPVEMDATIQSVRDLYPKRRMVYVFQPHRYTRTQSLFNELIASLEKVDELILLDVYPASEELIEGACSSDLQKALESNGKKCQLVKNAEEAYKTIKPLIKNNDVLVIQGAGDVARLLGFIN
ncbi:UDP-N-acetylmuramate--L-alanine ligase [Francisellaceae bacterium]|nr:UDP-N-acetylmuramate--L-alanine ligase [Francisellaceae bacterium]